MVQKALKLAHARKRQSNVHRLLRVACLALAITIGCLSNAEEEDTPNISFPIQVRLRFLQDSAPPAKANGKKEKGIPSILGTLVISQDPQAAEKKVIHVYFSAPDEWLRAYGAQRREILKYSYSTDTTQQVHLPDVFWRDNQNELHHFAEGSSWPSKANVALFGVPIKKEVLENFLQVEDAGVGMLRLENGTYVKVYLEHLLIDVYPDCSTELFVDVYSHHLVEGGTSNDGAVARVSRLKSRISLQETDNLYPGVFPSLRSGTPGTIPPAEQRYFINYRGSQALPVVVLQEVSLEGESRSNAVIVMLHRALQHDRMTSNEVRLFRLPLSLLSVSTPAHFGDVHLGTRTIPISAMETWLKNFSRGSMAPPETALHGVALQEGELNKLDALGFLCPRLMDELAAGL